MNDKTYAAKLSDPRWQRKRLEVMQAANFTCQICGDREQEQHAHHTCYREGLEPWEYPDRAIICVCNDCHTLCHIPSVKLWAMTRRLLGRGPKGDLGKVDDRFLAGILKNIALVQESRTNVNSLVSQPIAVECYLSALREEIYDKMREDRFLELPE